MTTLAGRLARIEGRRNAAGTRRLIDEVAAHAGLDVGSLRAEVDRVLAWAAAADGWSAEAELDRIAAETGLPVAELRGRYEGIMAQVER